jgi:hypothetical protein
MGVQMGSWSQVWHAFAAAVLAQPPMIAILIAAGSVLVVVMAAEGLLVSFFPHHVARRMRVLPPLVPADEDLTPRIAPGGDIRDMRIEPGFNTLPMVDSFQRRSAPIQDFRSRPPALKVVRDMRDSAPEN